MHRQLLRYAEPHLAAILDYAGNVLGTNETCARWLGLSDPTPGDLPLNAALWVFTKDAEERIRDLDNVRATAVAHIRQTRIRYPDDAVLTAILDRLMALPEAAKYWRAQTAVTPRNIVDRYAIHPRHGDVHLLGTVTELPDGLQIAVLFRSLAERDVDC
ncbi:MmyB family transcriptional regulator [Embleya sp. NPDC055664]